MCCAQSAIFLILLTIQIALIADGDWVKSSMKQKIPLCRNSYAR